MPPEMAQQQPEPAAVARLISKDFEDPVQITTSPAHPGGLIIVEREGVAVLYSLKEDSTREILDISDLVGDASDQGLLSLAFPKGVKESTVSFFANYLDSQGDLVVAGFHASNEKPADEESMGVVIKIARFGSKPPRGGLATSSTGELFVTTADSEERAAHNSHATQSSTSLLGKILRITPKNSSGYQVPSDNPFRDQGTFLPEIWALGFRDPSQITIDDQNGMIIVIDNGQSTLEVNLAESGKNYAWDTLDGEKCLSENCAQGPYRAPILAIPRRSPSDSLVGGVPYRGTALPELVGSFMFAESASGTLFAAKRDEGGTWHQSHLLDLAKPISAIGHDANGEIYMTTSDGSLFKLTPPTSGGAHTQLPRK